MSSKDLAQLLYPRIKAHLARRDVFKVRPVGFGSDWVVILGNGGEWHPYRLNECFKFGMYQENGHFAPHVDGPWVPREVSTVLLGRMRVQSTLCSFI